MACALSSYPRFQHCCLARTRRHASAHRPALMLADVVPARHDARRLLGQREVRWRAWLLGRAGNSGRAAASASCARLVHRRMAAAADGRRTVGRPRPLRAGGVAPCAARRATTRPGATCASWCSTCRPSPATSRPTGRLRKLLPLTAAPWMCRWRRPARPRRKTCSAAGQDRAAGRRRPGAASGRVRPIAAERSRDLLKFKPLRRC